MTEANRATAGRTKDFRNYYWPLIRFALVASGIVMAAAFWLWLTFARDGGLPVDFINYWRANPKNLYPLTDAQGALSQGYVYTPAFEFFAQPWRLLPFLTALAIYRIVLLVILVRLAGPFTIFVLPLLPVASEINCGNIQLVLAMALVLSYRWPSAWAFLLLTKVGPGVGLLYYLLRREWHSFAIAIATTAVVAFFALVLFWSQWPAYIQLMSSPAPTTGPYYITFWHRLPIALAIVVVGAWRGWRWSIVLAAFFALPNWYYISPSILVGLLPTLRTELGRRFLGAATHTAIPEDAPAAPRALSTSRAG